ncbi:MULTISPECIES: hypothetical protein [Pseudomonas]|uniref:hypothetical protein n=1 Tax=Pseudomonas TaxID=286 RepID=UPI0009EC98F2|nr:MULTISPECIES: hypothetical protein [Pseudomonas]MCP8351658.1 hypothetical protein [Pseudomonas sp. FBF18]
MGRSRHCTKSTVLTVASTFTRAPSVNLGYIGGRAEQVVFVRGFDRLPVPVYSRGLYIVM